MGPYPLVSAKNLPAYATVMLLWVLVSVALALLLVTLTDGAVRWPVAVGFAAVSVMLGMSIMFGASAELEEAAPRLRTLGTGGEGTGNPARLVPGVDDGHARGGGLEHEGTHAA